VLIITGTDNADIITFSPTGDTIGIGISSNGSAIASADILYSQFDSIQIHAGGGNDNVVIDQNGQLSQSITIDLNEGNDHVSLDHIGSVAVSGGDGNDSIDAQESGYAFNGDAGIDTINDFHFDPFGMNLQNTPTTENAHIRLGTLTGNALDNDLSTQLSKTASPMSGLGGNDTLTVGEETPYGISDVDGGDGDDLINGGSGELIGGNGNDTINGGSFSEGGAGNDSLVGGLSMDGGDDNDTLIGQSRDEALFGGNGNDSLDGGEGNDTLDGGLGADILKGGTGLDTLDYSSRTNPVSIGPGSLADDGEANEHDNVATDIETLIGGQGNDLIKGTADNNLLIGNGGNDSILGNFGNDTLSGNAGTDTLNGENGDDTAINSAGDQLISIEHAT
jgi:Ca2+-binding RTX toxin-like protein